MYSFLQPVADVISYIITFLYHLTVMVGFPSYALAIILISIIIKLLLYPLMRKQMKSTMNMQEIQPKLEYLQKRYANNPEKMNQEVMKLYKEYDIKPMAGCLPLLIQFPILIGLYMALREYPFIPLEHARFFWVPNLGEADPLYILPISVAVTMFIQQKLSMVGTANSAQNSTMKIMLFLMPAMMLFVCWSMPAGLCLYWSFFSILSIIQQFFMNRKKAKEIAARQAREEEEKERRIEEKKAKMLAKKEADGKGKKKKKPSSAGTVSLQPAVSDETGENPPQPDPSGSNQVKSVKTDEKQEKTAKKVVKKKAAEVADGKETRKKSEK